jgi:hypothetical protein
VRARNDPQCGSPAATRKGRRYGATVSEDAALVIQSVKVDGRPCWVSAFSDHVAIIFSDDTRTIPIRDIARITHKTGIRTGRIGIVTVGGEQLVIRGVRARDTAVAYQILVKLASSAG